jgi:PAS domain S-box-containing protein
LGPSIFSGRTPSCSDESTGSRGVESRGTIIAANVRPRLPFWHASGSEPPRSAPSLREVAQYLAFAAVYVVAAKLGFQAAFVAEQVSPVWPPTGLALWALLYFGARAWPAVWIGALVANMTTHVPILPACGIAIGNTLEALVGAWLLSRMARIDHSLDGLRQVVIFIVAASLSTTISATVGLTTLCVAGMQPWANFGALWWTWWLGDTTGALLVAPLLLTVPLWRGAAARIAGIAEVAALEVTAIALSIVVFTGPPTGFARHRPLEYLVFPLMMWAGLRFAHPGAALLSATVSCIAVWGTLQGAGPFSGGSSPSDSISLLQIYSAVIATSGLVFGAAIADRNRAERLRDTDHLLTSILSQEHDLKGAARQLLKAVSETLTWDVGILWQVDTEQRTLEYVDSWQRDNRTDAFVADSRVRRFQAGIGLPGRVWATAQPAWISDVVVDPNFPRSPLAARSGLHGGFAFPIRVGPRVLGVMEYFTRDPRPVDVSLLTLMAAAGSQVGQFIERGRAQQRVAESEARISAIVEAALDCIISIDANGTIIEFNPAAVQTFGFSRDEVLGRELAEVIVPARLRDFHREGLRLVAQGGDGRILGQRLEMPARRADGTEITVELAVTRVVAGHQPVFTAHLRDITDRKRIERERTELLEREQAARLEAENANRSKDQFLAMVSHELRTPLTAILGWASMLRTRQFDSDRLPQIYDTIIRNAHAQTQIVNDLLDVSRIVTGQLRLEWQETDVCEVARLSLETIRPTATAKGVVLESDIPSTGCVVSGDPARLQQVMWNLLLNATKFTPAGRTIALAVRASGSGVIIEVSDSGIGIAEEFLPHLFERFWQADATSSRAHGGLGLGLALVRHIVEAHGGEVQARSDGERSGSTFTVTLPARVAPHQSPVLIDAHQQTAGSDLQGLTVLVVDDDAGTRELFSMALQGEGARVVCAESAAEAMKSFRRQPTDVLIIDIGMPGEDGTVLLQRIRAHEAAYRLPQAPAIAVTGYASDIVRADALQAGFTAFVPKPVLPLDLLSVVQETANGRV